MLCPDCKSAVCRRSRRRGLKDRAMSALGFLPWRCGTCQSRFFARTVAIRFLYLVHCPNCGDLDPQQLGRDRVFGGLRNSLKRILRLPAYRCEACRNRFFSLRLFQPVLPTSFVEFGGDAATPAVASPEAAGENMPESESSAAEAVALDDSTSRGL